MPGSTNHYHVFETSAGFIGLAWNSAGISSLRLPSGTEREAARAVFKRLPHATMAQPPAAIASIIADIQRYFDGEPVDFLHVPVDLGEQEPLFAQIYALVRGLGRAETTTYGTVAKQLVIGPEFARDVGQAMAHNPVPLIVPCHRVLGAGGKVGGFSAPGGSTTKMRMLVLEGVEVEQAPPKAKPAQNQGAFGF